MKKVYGIIAGLIAAYLMYSAGRAVTTLTEEKPSEETPLKAQPESIRVEPPAAPETAEDSKPEDADADKDQTDEDQAEWWEKCTYNEPTTDTLRELSIDPDYADEWSANKAQCSKLCRTYNCSEGGWFTEDSECFCILKQEYQAGEDEDGLPTDLFYLARQRDMRPNEVKGKKDENTTSK